MPHCRCRRRRRGGGASAGAISGALRKTARARGGGASADERTRSRNLVCLEMGRASTAARWTLARTRSEA
jgi:hypothetical protein